MLGCCTLAGLGGSYNYPLASWPGAKQRSRVTPLFGTSRLFRDGVRGEMNPLVVGRETPQRLEK